MIGIALTTILVLVLVGLLVDWQGVLRRFRRHSQPEPERFSFETPEAEPEPELTVEPAYPEPPVPLPVMVEGPHPDPAINEMLETAEIHFRKGEMKEAEEFYLQVAAKDPKCSKAYSRLGVIYLENGENWQDAEEAFRQALKYDGENGYILNNLGLVLYHQDRYADAIRQFEGAVRQEENNAARHANLGMAYMAMRQYAKAESAFKKALKLAPNEMEYKDLLNEAIEKKKAHKTMIRN